MGELGPAGAARGPGSLAELVHTRPPGQRDEVFPRELLERGELVLFETRPAALWRSDAATQVGVGGVAVGAFFVLFGLLLLLTGDSSALAADGACIIGALIGLPSALGLLWVRRVRRSRAYALTDRRVLSVGGPHGTEFHAASWGSVVGASLAPDDSSTLLFGVQSPGADAGAPRWSTIYWSGLASGPRTYEFVQSAFRLESRADAGRERLRAVRAALGAGRRACTYCGNLVVVVPAVGDPGRCPRCAAPLDAAGPPEPTVPVVRPDPTGALVPTLRPIVELNRRALALYRRVIEIWAAIVALVLVTLTFAALPPGNVGAGGLATGELLVLIACVPVAYVYWWRSLRGWSGSVDFLASSLSSAPEPSAHLTGPLQRRVAFAYLGMAASLGLLVVVLDAVVGPSASMLGAPDGDLVILSTTAFLGSVVLGQAALADGFQRPALGSEIPSIERGLHRGRGLTLVGLSLGLWPVVALAVDVTLLGTATAPVVWLFLPWALGPALAFLGTLETQRALAEWSDLADRFIGADPSPTRGYLLPATSLVAHWADDGRSSARWNALAFAVVALVVGVGVAAASSGALSGIVGQVESGSPVPTTHYPPDLIIRNGTRWLLLPDRYEATEVQPNHTGTLFGNVSADFDVTTYVMTGTEFSDWTTTGSAFGAPFSALNASHARFAVPVDPETRYYAVVVNYSPNAEVVVTWGGCVLLFHPSTANPTLERASGR